MCFFGTTTVRSKLARNTGSSQHGNMRRAIRRLHLAGEHQLSCLCQPSSERKTGPVLLSQMAVNSTWSEYFPAQEFPAV